MDYTNVVIDYEDIDGLHRLSGFVWICSSQPKMKMMTGCLTLTFALKLTPFSLQVKPLFVSLRA